MDRKDWRWMLPPWAVAWILLICSIATLVIVVRCCCSCRCGSGDGSAAGPSPEQAQPVSPLTKMRLSPAGSDFPDPKPVTNPTYRRATAPGGGGTVRPDDGLVPVPGAVGGVPAEHTPPSAEGSTQSVRLGFALEGEPMHVTPWITGVNGNGNLRTIKEVNVTLLRRDGSRYVVRVTMKVWNLTGSAIEPPDVTIPELVMDVGTL
ncbi:MAG: hypothetical protein U1E39_04310 [Planctomycetota bacterium]